MVKAKSRSGSKEQSALLIKDNHTGEIGVCFLDGPAEYINEMFAKGPSKTIYGELESKEISRLLNLHGASVYTDDLEKTTPVNEQQLRAIYPHAVPSKMTDPLTRVDKTRIHDNVRRDGATKRVLLFIAYFMMPEPPVLTIGLNRKFATKQREKEQLSIIQDDPDYLDILEELMNRDDECDLYTRQIELVFAAHAYGRAVQVKQYDTRGYPKRLIPLSSPRLGRVWVDKYSWEFLGVEYNDYTRDKRILMAKDIIHYEIDDFQTTPNSRYYGMSILEPTMAIGERNRAANEIAIPEIMKRMFAPLMLVKSKSKSQAKLTQIRDAWKSGKTVFYNSDLEIVVVALPHDLEKLRDTVQEGSKQVFRDATVPLGVGWQDDQNRATFEGSVLQWYESVLSFKRSQFSNLFWRQWYKPQMEMMYQGRMAEKLSKEGGMMDYLVQKATQGTELPFRVNLDFKNVRTTGFLDTAAALAQFGDRRYLGRDQILEEAGFGKYIEQMNESPEASGMVPTFGQADNTMNGVPVPGNTNLATQGTSVFSKGLPTANTSSSDNYEG